MENLVTDLIFDEGTRFERKLGVQLEDTYWDKLFQDILKVEDKQLADDWQQAVKKSSGWTKYHRYMYSKKLGKLRNQTMDEFYNKSIVD